MELCDFVLEHLTISRFSAGNSYSISLSNSRFLELFEVNKLVKKEKDCSTCSILDFSFKGFLAWFDSWCVLIFSVLYYICLAPAEWNCRVYFITGVFMLSLYLYLILAIIFWLHVVYRVLMARFDIL